MVLVDTTTVVMGSSGLAVGVMDSEFSPVIPSRISVNDLRVDVVKVLGVVSSGTTLVMVELVNIWRFTCRGK